MYFKFQLLWEIGKAPKFWAPHILKLKIRHYLRLVADKWVKRFHQSTPHSIEKQMPSLSTNMTCCTSGSKHCLKKVWGIPVRVQRLLTDIYSKKASQQNISWWQKIRKQIICCKGWKAVEEDPNTRWVPSSNHHQVILLIENTVDKAGKDCWW